MHAFMASNGKHRVPAAQREVQLLVAYACVWGERAYARSSNMMLQMMFALPSAAGHMQNTKGRFTRAPLALLSIQQALETG